MARTRYSVWCRDENGREVEVVLSDADVRGLRARFPGVAVVRELNKMHWWSVKQPSRRWKVGAGVMRGIEEWLRRAAGQREAKLTKAAAEDARRAAQAEAAARVREEMNKGGPAVPMPAETRAMLERLRRGGGV